MKLQCPSPTSASWQQGGNRLAILSNYPTTNFVSINLSESPYVPPDFYHSIYTTGVSMWTCGTYLAWTFVCFGRVKNLLLSQLCPRSSLEGQCAPGHQIRFWTTR